MKTFHICARCGARFTSKAACWYHMDHECHKRPGATPTQSPPPTETPSPSSPLPPRPGMGLGPSL